MCQTPTFLNLYTKSKKIHPVMLKSLRLVIAGAEKLQKETYVNFKDKFGLEVYEGYGATEVAPVASCNFPDVVSAIDLHVHQAQKVGTVGLPLPGSAFRVVDPESYGVLPQGEEGMVLIGGTQVMKGYLDNIEKTKQSVIEKDQVRWYITGDKGFVDEEGFLTLIDRYSRFAKISGEMVSLSAVEQKIMKLAGTKVEDLMVVNMPSSSKGELLVLFYSGDVQVSDLISLLKEGGLNRFMFPKHIEKLDELPRFGSGKKNYVKAKQIAMESNLS
jgi:acyl-[acyl-carrier-protein]-phospholipid O-acyltransferase/long-chain-fatty-acid--[acyl-carrier-protein] ligase